VKPEHELHLRPEQMFTADHKLASAWRLSGLLIFASLVWLFTWYGETTLSTLAIWLRSDTYAHGFLIFPISAYLIWTRRRELLRIQPKPSLLGLIVLAGLGFSWLLADSAEVLVASQYALVAMVPALVWAILGTHVGIAILFPLLFLLFAVPVGEFLLPPMMNFTADFTVAALRITGIPVFREGNFFSVPSGSWSVVEACSGLRYLIASLTLGCLFAYLTYRTVWRRVAFIALSIVVPIIANGFRAYLIVMIGHLSNNKLATGVDHVIYGWVFFGFVMLLLFWVGSRWHEPIQDRRAKDASLNRR
jgi:exosortase A